MFTTDLTAEQRLQKAVASIMGRQEFAALSGILMIGERGIKDNVETAYTNGRDEYYGRAFVESLSDAELRFLVMHEVYHKMYKHLTTWQNLFKEDAQLANMAADYVINTKITKQCEKIRTSTGNKFLKMPDGGLRDYAFDGWNTQEVFEHLKSKQDNDGGNSGGNGKGAPLDEHGWEDAQELSAEEKQDLERSIDEAIRQGAIIAGKIGGDANSLSLNDLMQPEIDWREALREFISQTSMGKDYSTWSRPNRRYIGANVYMPSTISETVEELVIAIDTSGSAMSADIQTKFMSEVSGICEIAKPNKVRVIYWDTSVRGDEVYTREELHNLTNTTKPKGGYGTDIKCVVDHMQEHNIKPQAVIVLTDGYLGGNWGNWTVPVLWCLLDNAHTTPDNGKVLHINSRRM